MFPTLPAAPPWPWFTYLAIGALWLFLLGFWLACVVGLMRGCLTVLVSAWRGLVTLGQWLCGLPMTSGGTAHFATRREIARAGLLGATGVPLASFGQADTLREPHGGHVLVMGPPRSWKSTGIVMPAITQFPGSVVVNDLRGELFDRTHTARDVLGPTYRFAPTAQDSCAMNILDLVRWGTPSQFGDVHRIVHHLLSPPEREQTPNPFTDAAIPVLVSIVTHCHDQGAGHFPGVVRWMLEPSRSLKEKTDELLSSGQPLVTGGARRLADMSERLRASVVNACLTPLAIFEDPTIAANTRHSDVRFTALLEGLNPVSLYLCPSFADVRRLSGFLGACVEALVAVLGSPEQPPRYQVLFVLDEQANLGYLPELEKAISYLQGSGTQVLSAFQNIAQVHQVYGPHTPLLASFSTQVHFRPNDAETAEHIGALLGQTTVLKRSDSAQVTALGTWASTRSASESERDLLTVDEILRLGQTEALVVQAGCAPVRCRKQGVPAPTTGAQVRTLVSQHRQGCAVAACVLLVLVALWPALAPVWTAPPAPVAAAVARPAPMVQAALFPTPAAAPPLDGPPGQTTAPEALPPVTTASAVITPPQPPPWTLWLRDKALGDTPRVYTRHRTEADCLAGLDRIDSQEVRVLDLPSSQLMKPQVHREPGKLAWTYTVMNGASVRKEMWCAAEEPKP